jgi:hypothetical protein
MPLKSTRDLYRDPAAPLKSTNDQYEEVSRRRTSRREYYKDPETGLLLSTDTLNNRNCYSEKPGGLLSTDDLYDRAAGVCAPSEEGGGGGAAATHIIALATNDNIYIVPKTDATDQTVLTAPAPESPRGSQPLFLPTEQLIVYPEFSDWYSIGIDDLGRTLRLDVSTVGVAQAHHGAYVSSLDAAYIGSSSGTGAAPGSNGILDQNDSWSYTQLSTTAVWMDTAVDTVNEKFVHTATSGIIYSRDLADDISNSLNTANNNYISCACDETSGYVFGLRQNGQIDKFVWNDLAEGSTSLVVVATTAAMGSTGQSYGGAMVYDPDGDHLYVMHRTDGHLYRFDASGVSQISGTDLGEINVVAGMKGICLASIPE